MVILRFFCFFFWPCSLAEPVLDRWVCGICGSMSRNSCSLFFYLFFFFFVAVFLGCTSTGRAGLWFLLFYVQEHPKAQPAVVLVLKRLRRRSNGLKSHPTDWEKPGIEPATPGLLQFFLWPCSLAVPVLAGWVYAFCGSLSRNSRRLNRQWFWF